MSQNFFRWLFRLFVSVVAGKAGYPVFLFIAEIFFIDTPGHAYHASGNILVLIFIACKVKFFGVGFAFSVAKTALYAEGSLKSFHDELQLILANVLIQHLQILKFRFLSKAERTAGDNNDD